MNDSTIRQHLSLPPSLLFLVSLLCAAPALGQPAMPDCQPAAKSGFIDFVIDARNGAVVSGTGPRFKRSDRVRIVVVNKNPFRYQYQLTVEATPVTEPALTAFLGLTPLAGLIAAVDGEATPEKAPDDDAARKGPSCDLSPGELTALANRVESIANLDRMLTEKYDALLAQISEIGTALVPLAAAYRSHLPGLRSENATCADLRQTAEQLDRALAFGNLGNLIAQSKVTVPTLVAIADHQLAEIRRLETEISAACLAPHRARLATIRRNANLARLSRLGFEDRLAAFESTLAQLKAAKRDIATVRSTPTAFYSVRELSKFSVATDVTVTLKRKDLTQENSDLATVVVIELNFGGGPRFVLAAGLAFADLEVNEFDRVQGVELGRDGLPALDMDGNENLATVVKQTEDSSSRLTPLVILHGRLLSLGRDADFYFSTGLTVNTEGDGNVEYLIGPSLGLIDGRLFFTLGAYYGKRKELDGGFFPGMAVPEEVTSLPILEENKWSAAFAVSYKFK